jgi:molecular chaperone HscB
MSSMCWSCQSPADLFCNSCKALQPVSPLSAFERLDMAVTFDMDLAQVEQNYFKAQRLVHPDRFVGANKTEKVFSAQHSAAINEAYAILKEPIKRVQELLKITGHTQPNIEQQTLDDPELLMEVIELREELLEAQSLEQINGLRDRLETSFNQNLASMSEAFKTNDYQEAAKLLNRLRYLNKIRGEAQHKRAA